MQTCTQMFFIMEISYRYCVVTRLKKFQIPSIPPTTNKTIRFPNDIIEQVEKAIQDEDCTFSAFVVEAVKMALRELAVK